MRRHSRLFALIAALLALPVLAGCGGSGGGATAAGRAALNIYVTDGFGDAYGQVLVTLYKIELSTDGTSFLPVFEDAAGRTLDLRSLSDTAELLASVNVPEGSYTQARITFADHFTLVSADGTSASVAVDPAIGTPVGSGQIAVTVTTPTRVLADQTATLLIDFKLAKFQLVGGVLRPHVECGDGGDLGVKERTVHLRGTVAGLSAAGFDLVGRNGRTVPVTLTDATVISSAQTGETIALADGQSVLVEGAYDAAANTVTATAVTLDDRTGSPHGQRASGTVASVDAAAGSFVLTVESADGIQPTGGAITVQTDASTRFKRGRHQTAAFSDVVVGSVVRVGGAFDAATQTLTARSVSIR